MNRHLPAALLVVAALGIRETSEFSDNYQPTSKPRRKSRAGANKGRAVNKIRTNRARNKTARISRRINRQRSK